MIPSLDDNNSLEAQFLVAQALVAASATNGQTDGFDAFREAGRIRFSSQGFPAPRTELWKYTPVRRWLKTDFSFDSGVGFSELPSSEYRGDIGSYHAVCVDGIFIPSLSSIPDKDEFEGYIGAISKAKMPLDRLLSHLETINPRTETAFDALNQSFFQDGLLVHIPHDTELAEPLYITNLVTSGSNAFMQPRTLIVAESASKGAIIDLRDHDSGITTFENSVTQIHVGSGAQLDYYHVFDRGPLSHLIRKLNVYQEADSTCSTNELILSGALVRTDLNFLPDGEGCTTNLNGFYLAQSDTHIDVHTMVDHAKPDCVSNELFKGIIGDAATAVFNGRVLVRQDAQRINAYQSNRNIVLSDTAKMFSKPELEIYADDVKCSHGATTGQIDSEAMFYLRSRGIKESVARNLLLQAFAADVLALVSVDSLRERLQEIVAERLRKQSG